ncbi:hypothetical protein BDF14DRAFT_1752598 [Spinellus fusiger]|nr:hypothetical protein BDF14DRAFT_1752598 [Spinellus fusiger]
MKNSPQRPSHYRSHSDFPHRPAYVYQDELSDRKRVPVDSGGLCAHCHRSVQYGHYEAVDGSVYHPACLQCVGCRMQPTDQRVPFEEEWYDYQGGLYCRYHYSLLRGTCCVGCHHTVLGRFVEHKEKVDQRWHSECYMLHKHWRIHVGEIQKQSRIHRMYPQTLTRKDTSTLDPRNLFALQEATEQQCTYIWARMSDYEASSASYICDILMHMAAGAYSESILMAHQLTRHLLLLLGALDVLEPLLQSHQLPSHQEHSENLCNKLGLFFDLLCQLMNKKQPGWTGEVVPAVTHLAHVLKDLMRVGLVDALDLEYRYDHLATIQHFLQALSPPLDTNIPSTLPPSLHTSLDQLKRTFHEAENTFPKLPEHLLPCLPGLEKNPQPSTSVVIGQIRRAKAVRESRPHGTPMARHNSVSTRRPFPMAGTSSSFTSLVNKDKILREWAIGKLMVLLDWPTEAMAGLLEVKKPSLWGKLKTHMRVGTLKHDANVVTPTFGVPLSSLDMHILALPPSVTPIIPLASGCGDVFHPNAQVPHCIQWCLLAMLSKDMGVEGIFRKNGNIRHLTDMCKAINEKQDECPGFYTEENPIQLAALLKRFLRELPEPLLTFRLYKLFLKSLSMACKEDTKTVLHLACCLLPKPNRDLLLVILVFLSWTTQFQTLNRMDSYNLACVIAPNILYYTAKDNIPLASQEEEIRVVQLLIEYQEDLCMVPSALKSHLQEIQYKESTHHLLKTYNQVMTLTKTSESTPTTAMSGAMPISQHGRRNSWIHQTKQT